MLLLLSLVTLNLKLELFRRHYSQITPVLFIGICASYKNGPPEHTLSPSSY